MTLGSGLGGWVEVMGGGGGDGGGHPKIDQALWMINSRDS